MKGKDLVSIADLTTDDIWRLIEYAIELKKGGDRSILDGRTLALIFEKPSLRTRVSFDIAMYQLGGHALYLSPNEVGLGVREPVSDVARVLSRYVNGIVARTFAHTTVEELARKATVPIINGLSDKEHPCQAVADFLTIYEKKGGLQNLTLAFVGDANNVANSLVLGACLLGMHFRIAAPQGYQFGDNILACAREFAAVSSAQILCTDNPEEAVKDADVIYTDVWTSMGQEAELEQRRLAFAGYQINSRLLGLSRNDVLIMHPLPAHHGEEIAEGLIDCPQSVIFDQAENRLHAQKAILAELMGY